MNSNKFLLGGLAGGVVYFVLGYVFYGLLLKKFFDENGMMVDMDKMIWWAMIAGNLAAGFLFSYIIGKANASTMGGGAAVGFVVGLLMALGFDLTMYGIGHGMSGLKPIAVDVAVSAVITAIAGAVIGWVYGMGKKAA